ncbi:hypothetical protein EON65_10955 [archaeon]|nr:MAG: hypothetical protein EON65_10955 [archaeon]
MDNKSTLDNPFQFTYQQRRNHYQIKIAKLERETVQLQQERAEIDKRRISQTMTMRSKEKRLCALNLENERLKHYHSSVITSDVLAGADMQYNTVDYRIRIEKELEKVIQDIANLKYTIITNENRRQEIKKKIAQLEDNHKDRIAKAKEFETNYQKTMRVLSRLNKHGQDSERTLLLFFRRLQQYRLDRISLRTRIANMFNNVLKRCIKSAFNRWSIGKFAVDSSDTTEMTGIGDVMLAQSFEKRLELQDQLRYMVTNTVGIQQQLSLISLPKNQKQQLVISKHFKQMSEGYDVTEQYHQGLTLLYEGNGYAKENKFDLAQHCYEAQVILLRSKQPVNIKLLAITHNKLGAMFLALHKSNRALIEFDRQLSLAREIADLCEECDAYAGLGKGYLMNYDYENAIRYLSIAQAQYRTLGRYLPYFDTLQALKTCYEKLNKADKVALFQAKIEEMADNVHTRITKMHSTLDGYTHRLAHTAADIELVVPIERITLKALELRGQIADLNSQLKEVEDQYKNQDEAIEQIQFLMSEIKKELEKAIETDEPEMYSALVHDQPQVVEIEELKTRLKQRGQQEFDRLIVEQQTLNKYAVRRKNIENSIAECDYQYNLEQGELMKHQVLSRSFRCIALCSTNAAGNEVTGTATGGYEEFAASEGSRIHLIDYHNGELVHIFTGKESVENSHLGIITCLLHDGKRIFSGGNDEKIICWDTIERSHVRSFLGHEGSIVALAAETNFLVSSSADLTMRLWNKHTGTHLRVIFGHSKSVLTMEIGPTWMISGSTDTEVRIWRIVPVKKVFHVESAQRLQGHTAPVTCVKYGNAEVVSGDQQGNIYIWWLKTGTILRTCTVHRGPVRCMQFDSVHIVSGGMDQNVCITDIATGEVLQSLRGHTGSVLALAFDTERILSVGGDNAIRYWQWGKRSAPQDKHHVLEDGETLVAVGKKYEITLDQLLKWNGITDLKKVHTGMKLIVKKGDPNKPTDAERAALEREHRLANTRSVINKKLAKLQGKSLLTSQKFTNRVHKLAMDIDTFSLGNRLFGKEIEQLELFPSTNEAFEDKYSLASRLKFDLYHHNDATTIDKIQKDRSPVYIAAGNEDEWGHVADQLGDAMLGLLVEGMAYEVALEQKKRQRDKQSVIGRIFKYEQDKKQSFLTSGSSGQEALTQAQEHSGGNTLIHHHAAEDSAEVQEALSDLFAHVNMETIVEEDEEVEASTKHEKLPPIHQKCMK